MKILVADDSRVMRQIVIRTLRQAGYDDHDIVEAEDGADALAKVASEQPDLVLSDWNMPNMTGIECLQALRASGLGRCRSASSPRRAPRRCGRRPPAPAPCSSSPSRSPRTPSRTHLDGVLA